MIVQSRREEFTYGDTRKPKYPDTTEDAPEPDAEPEPLSTPAAEDSGNDGANLCGALMKNGDTCTRLESECPYGSHKR